MNVKSALTLGILILLGLSSLGYIAGTSAIRFKEYERTVTVKGLAEQEHPADIVLWPIQYSVASNKLPELLGIIETNAKRISAFLENNGFDQKEITKSPPNITDRLAQGYDSSRIEYRYTAIQVLTVYSREIDKARATMGKLEELGRDGIVLANDSYQNTTEYLFTRLNEIKPGMVEEATRNARQVAVKFAQDSNSKLGKIKKARQGQFSIGNRDKNNPHIKRVRVVSTIEYYLSD